MAAPPLATPLYVRLAHALEAEIAQGVYPPQEALPSERALAEARQVSRVTARKAIQVLVEQGLVVCRHGSGNFIAPRLSQSPSSLTSFSNELRQRGLEPSNCWIAQQVAAATAADAQALGLVPGTPIAQLERLRLANGQPLAYERSVLPCTVVPQPHAVGDSLYHHLAHLGHFPARAVQRIRACNATASMAQQLEIAPHAAVLWIVRTSFDAQGLAMEFTQTYCRSDAYDFISELKAPP
jgi:GntR family transcriptional regulator